MTAPVDHDSYLATLDPVPRAALQALREVVRSALPADARETVSYGIPAWRAGPGKGKPIVGYAAMKAHLGLYAFDGAVVGQFSEKLAGFSYAQGTIRFTPEHPLPNALIREIVAARLVEAGL